MMRRLSGCSTRTSSKESKRTSSKESKRAASKESVVDEAETITEQFRKFDANGDGLISREELALLFRKLDPTKWDDAMVDTLFDAVDSSGDGVVQFEEFVQWVMSSQKGEPVKRRSANPLTWMRSKSSTQEDNQSNEALLLESSKVILRDADWEQAMEGTSRAAATVLPELPVPEGSEPDDVESVDIYLHHFDPNPETAEEVVGADRSAALRWLRGALFSVEQGDSRFREPARWLAANCRLWDPDCDDPHEPSFVELKGLAIIRLREHGGPLEAHFRAGDFEALGRLGGSQNQSTRQDRYLEMPGVLEACDLDEGLSYIPLLLCSAHALQPFFRTEMSKICNAAGGESYVPAPKCFMRMVERLFSDHANHNLPQSAANADVLRATLTFDTVAQLVDGFERTNKSLGSPLRLQNKYNDDIKVMKRTGGFRSIVAYFEYQPRGMRWGPLVKDQATEAAWRVLHESMEQHCARLSAHDSEHEHHTAESFEDMIGALNISMNHFRSQEMKRERAAIVVEVQFLLRPYLEMRKRTHLWARVAFAESAAAMSRDLCSMSS